MTLATTKYVRKPLYVEAVQVTPENFSQIAEWCGGEVVEESPTKNGRGNYIKVRVTNPMNARQSQAFVGDWILYTPRGYKVYTPKAFHNSFVPVETNQLQLEVNQEETSGAVA